MPKDLELEIWKPVKAYEGLYEVSTYGNIRRGGKLLKQAVIGRGYKRVSLCSGNFKENALVHRLVLYAFKENFHQKPCCNHKDNDPANNHIDNLEWCTYSENEIHARKMKGTVQWNKGKKMNQSYRDSCRRAHLGVKLSESHKKRMSEAQKKAWVYRKQRIAQLQKEKELLA